MRYFLRFGEVDTLLLAVILGYRFVNRRQFHMTTTVKGIYNEI